MFNLIVQVKPWSEGTDFVSADRIFESTDPGLVSKFKPNGTLDLASLKALPCVFMEEFMQEQGERVVARVGTIINAYPGSGRVTIEYVYDPSVPPLTARQMVAMSGELGISSRQHSRTHWSIKTGDLYRAILRHGKEKVNKPTVFKLNEPPKVEVDLVAVMMPFSSNFQAVYDTLKDAAGSAGFQCRRADENDIWKHPELIQDIVTLIDRAAVVVADCSQRNPNVFYEIGIAHALGREVILIAQSDNDIPFDLRHFRYITYLNNAEGRASLAETLVQKLKSYV